MIFGYKVFGIFIFLGIICLIGPRVENDMDEKICRKRLANHNISNYNILAVIFTIIEILFDYILNK